MKVEVKDSDSINNHDEVEKFRQVFEVRPHRSEDLAPWVQHTLVGTRSKTKPAMYAIHVSNILHINANISLLHHLDVALKYKFVSHSCKVGEVGVRS